MTKARPMRALANEELKVTVANQDNQIKNLMSSTQALINTANGISTSDVLAYRASLLSLT